MGDAEKSPLLDSDKTGSNSHDTTSTPTSPTVTPPHYNPNTSTQSSPSGTLKPSQPSTSSNTDDEVDGAITVQRSRQSTLSDDGHPQEPREIKLYLRRFWVLFLFSVMACFQDVQWMTWGPIEDSVGVAFSGWGSKTVSMMANWGTIMFVLFVVPMCWLMTAKGLRVGVLTCAALIAFGTIVRLIPFLTTSDTFFTVMCHICAICVGIPGTLVMAAPPLIAAEWFPPKERTTATAVSQAMNQLGSAVGYIEPLLVRAPNTKDPSQGPTPEEIRSDIKRLLYLWAGVGSAIFLAILIYFPPKPPTPPSRTAHVERLDFKNSVRKMLRTKDVLLVTVSYGINNGLPSAWISVLNYSLWDLGIGQVEAMWIGLSSVVVSVVATLAAARLTDYVYGYLKPSLMFCIISSMACFYWFFLLSWGAITVTKWQIYASVIGGMSFSFAASPLFFELAVEICYPCSEVNVGGLLTGANNMIGLTFLFIFFIPNIGFEWVTYLLVGAGALSLIPLLFVNEDYSRSTIDRGHLQHSAYQPI